MCNQVKITALICTVFRVWTCGRSIVHATMARLKMFFFYIKKYRLWNGANLLGKLCEINPLKFCKKYSSIRFISCCIFSFLLSTVYYIYRNLLFFFRRYKRISQGCFHSKAKKIWGSSSSSVYGMLCFFLTYKKRKAVIKSNYAILLLIC